MCTCVIFSAPLQGAWVPCHVLRFHNINPDPRRTPVFGPPRIQNPDFYVLCPEFLRWLARILVPDFSPEFVSRIFVPQAQPFWDPKKNQGENQGTCAPARAGWCESLPRVVAELLRFLALQSGGPLQWLVFVHAEAAHTIQFDFLVGGRGGVF